jgi:hypothetical protein
VNKPTNTKPDQAVQGALRLAEENFEREYASEGVGVVMPGVVAVDEQGRQLEMSALLPDLPKKLPSDQLYVHAVEEAFRAAPDVDRAAVAYAAVRIDAGWPRIISWHRQADVTCEAKPHFLGDALTNWTEKWGSGFSETAPDGPREGLIKLQLPGIGGAGLVLMVRKRIRAGARP